ncbi:aldehyde dehydrogenase family protein [Alienimonas chondri]|uniref:3,6-anhydro-alpha-L-galactose dehydrogenase n=1 Tax=Alienimonas chondri TaxID=2681879 RepID=A0ABX1VBP4_9PLAN|nr:aldehyde dehydrogenase family protein [Alienimonas chondri]NNJ24707.1 3,6-anhydro-alpha-L-galactose dehydrogenase [Alienimonas chondri]
MSLFSGSKDYQFYAAGRWQDGDTKIEVLNPSDESVLATTPDATAEQCTEALEFAKTAQKAWGRLTGVERGNALRKWADLVDANKEKFAQLLAKEVGKPIREARGEIDFGNSWLRYYAGFDRHIDGEILSADQPNEQLWLVPQPAGVAVGVIAWNFPYAVACRKIAPALIAGCAIVLKPHEDTPLTALELAKLAEEAGVPPGIVSIVTGRGATAGAALTSSPLADVISFTGSVATGKAIAKAAAENVTFASLELGGKAPFLVLNDADVDEAVDIAVFSRFLNCGQICTANERTYVQRGVYEQFLDKYVAKVEGLSVGDPLNEDMYLGPKVNKTELEKVDRMVKAAVAAGATTLTGGGLFEREGAYEKGYWYKPTVVTGVDNSSPLMRDEIFGPVSPVAPFDDFEEGIALANDTKFGLAGYLITNDMNKIMRAVRDLELGELYINRGCVESIHGYHTGWKQSGVGGDDGKKGLEHYLRYKSVYLKYQG